ncbi:MAG: mechanosensitive ion channel family protein [Bacteriovoracaceae bacterium]|jgi:small conductance mechanosensitive channel|nr:mechanosensitive ion channel family protein [Bacteriovoracaceae bacterium]
MNSLSDLAEFLFNLGRLWLPFSLIMFIGIMGLISIKKLLNWRKVQSPTVSVFNHDLILFILTAVILLFLIFLLPISEQSRGQILNLIGILFTATIALSSTTLMGNAMAGIMLRIVGRFKGGDFLQVAGHFGRVTERGFLHTEIQTEDRDLETFSNLFLIKHPFKVIYQSGTIISAQVSLGYDICNEKVMESLKIAAIKAGLTDPFVQIMELGDYSITYRAAGFLKEVKYFISARSKLRLSMLDELHYEKIEIVSPTFMNQRVYDSSTEFISKKKIIKSNENLEEHGLPEEIVFDKADQAASLEVLKGHVEKLSKEIVELKKNNSPSIDDKIKLKIYLEHMIKTKLK